MNRGALICFAVKQEARPFQKLLRARTDVRILLTGMGTDNARMAVCNALHGFSPEVVFSCGFAGALNPDLRVGMVLFDLTETSPERARRLQALGARAATFTCAQRVAVTPAEKLELRTRTGCDAVEMESKAIAEVCAERGIECMTVRAVSDSAEDELPLDFNVLMTPDKRLDVIRLAFAILRAPHRIPAIIRLGRNSAFAAQQLASVLTALI